MIGMKCLLRMMLLPMLVLTAVPGLAAEIHGSSSTQFLWFNNELLDNKRQVDINQYLRLSVTNIDKDGKFSIQGYGRGSQDLTAGEGLNGRLYYLYGDYRGLYDKVDIKIGRQFVNLAAGSAIIDGAQVDLKNVGPVAFTALGGRDVLFGLNGEIGDPGNTAMGLAAYLQGYKRTEAELSWFRKWDGGDVARDSLGAAASQYLLNSLKLYGNARFDLVSETFNETLAGIKYYPMANLIFTAEYYESYPIFDTTSIYSVFAVNQYKEGVFRVDYAINEKISVNGGYNRQGYGNGGYADVYHVGTGIRPIEPLKLNVEYDKRSGYYGNFDGFIADVEYDIMKKAQVAAGINYDVYQRDALTGDEIARRYWFGGKYKLNKTMTLSSRVQNDVNVRYGENISGRVAFDLTF